ncbi:MAG: restriction endonuclease subunit S [Fibrobacterales bacterium]
MSGVDINHLITEHLDLWTSTLKSKATIGRGSSKKVELYGVKKLRELILDLAVQGKLVSQDLNDEPASVLLEKITAEKERLVETGQIKKIKPLQPISNEETLFEVLDGWAWCRLQDISNYIQRGKGPKYSEEGNVKVVSQKCVQWSSFDIDKARYVDDSSLEVYQEERYLLKNDMLWNSTGNGTVGRVVVLPDDLLDKLVADSHVTVVRCPQVIPQYVKIFCSSALVQSRIDPNHPNSLVSGSTNQVELNTSSVSNLPIPVPPKFEQVRIVAKVNELMILCDELEAQTEKSLEAHQLLVETLLNTLANSQNSEELNQNWIRIADHFDTLFTTEKNIDSLEETILQLAVMGKLVPQDPNDEPASVLLETIATEKDRLIEGKKLKKGQLISDSKTLISFSKFPTSWSCVKGSEIFFITKLAGFEYTQHIKLGDSGDVAVIRAQNVKRMRLKLDNLKYIDLETSLLLERCALSKEALLVTFIGAGIGDVALFSKKERWHLAPNVAKMELFENCDSLLCLQYFNYFLASSIGSKEIFKHLKATAQPSISMGTIRDIDYLVPPLAEQKRIVARVDELRKVCDALRHSISLNNVVLGKLTDSLVK